MAVKVLESVHEVIEEIEEEYLVLRDHGRHPNLPSFFGIFLHKTPSSSTADQLWIAMEVSRAEAAHYSPVVALHRPITWQYTVVQWGRLKMREWKM